MLRRVRILSRQIMAIVVGCVFLLNCTGKVFANECPKGMSQLNCASIIGNWTGWVPDAGCNNSSSGDLVGNDNIQKAYNFFVGNGLSNVQAAAVVGNLDDESAGLNPLIKEVGGTTSDPSTVTRGGWGIAQWTPGSTVLQYAKDNNITGDITQLATQLNLVWAQMNGAAPTGFKNVTAGLKQINDLSQAVSFFQHNFEAGIDGNRQQDAQEIMQQYGGSAQVGSTGASASAPAGECASFASGSCTVTQPVYTPQYSQTQLAAIFGDPGSANNHPGLHLVTATFLGFTTQVNPKVAPCLEAVSKQLQQEGETYKVTQFGCYRFDSNNGTSNIGLSSYHTYGAACDINWDTNPFVESGAPTAHDMPEQFIDAFRAHGFTWGGSWTQPKDYMHFEWHGVMPPS